MLNTVKREGLNLSDVGKTKRSSAFHSIFAARIFENSFFLSRRTITSLFKPSLKLFRTFTTTSYKMAPIQVGDTIPAGKS